jgi:hypothetical protein
VSFAQLGTPVGKEASYLADAWWENKLKELIVRTSLIVHRPSASRQERGTIPHRHLPHPGIAPSENPN